MRTRIVLPLIAVLAVVGGGVASAAMIPLVNPGAEEGVDGLGATGNLNSPNGSGWDVTLDFTAGSHGAAIQGAPTNSGIRRFNIGVQGIGTGLEPAIDPTTLALYQVTGHTVAAGEELTLDFFAHGAFQYGAGDGVVSFFGYFDAMGDLQIVDELTTTGLPLPPPSVNYAALTHTFSVGAASPLIGEQLAIGFRVSTDDGAFVVIDDVSLSVVPEPMAAALAVIGGLGGVGAPFGRRSNRRRLG